MSAARDSVFALMDVSPSDEVEQSVIKAIKSVPGIEEYFNLRLRKSGPFIFGETKVGIRKFVDVKRAHEIADRIEREVKKKVSQVDSLAVHVEPFKSKYHHLVIPVKAKKRLVSPIADQFGRAPYFLFVNLKGKKVKGHYFLENLHQKQKVRAGLAVAKLVTKQKSQVLITKEIGEISYHILKDYLFDLYQTQAQTTKKAIEQFNQGKLTLLKKPTKKR